jgi:hypothetical protein
MNRLLPRLGLASPILAAVLSVAPAAAMEVGRPLGDIVDNATLRSLEDKGYGLGQAFGIDGRANNAELHRASAAYKRLVETVGSDIRALRGEMEASGRRLYEITDGNVGRVFEPAWLISAEAKFRLVALVVRFDRRDFAAEERREATCGELRFLYRLAYDFRRGGRHYASRMPFSVNVVHDIPKPEGSSCQAVAQRFVAPRDHSQAAMRADWTIGGPIQAANRRPRQIEINAQIVRFPSGQETTFGGQAAYLMRVFGVLPGEGPLALYDRPLENTPDVQRINADAALRDDLAAFLRDRAGEVDRGVFQVPERFLATKVISYSTYGSARLANRPYTQIFGAAGEAFARLSFDGLTVARSPRGFLDRLDTGTCQGCHQSNATAGFHVIGEDDPTISPLNRVLVGVSPHFHAERPRREAYARAVVEGRDPNRFRPLPMAPPAAWNGGNERPSYRAATLGLACVPEASRRHVGEAWSCGAGVSCSPLAENAAVGVEFGQCMVNERRAEFSGQACLAGRIQTASIAQPWLDRFLVTGQLNSRARAINFTDHTCRPPVGGAPAGLAYRKCTDEDRRFAGFGSGQAAPNEICGFAGGRAFDICVATNDFANCLGASIVRGMRATCSAERLCREDFMCQALPADLPEVGRVAGLGYCSPTYFLFQMRLDGHPDPRRRS